jgi:hypothetical protein
VFYGPSFTEQWTTSTNKITQTPPEPAPDLQQPNKEAKPARTLPYVTRGRPGLS